ncbi:hypothetical protein NL676_033866 [Syzygium grande]|nr:hypothetical protein NL676_033866 [Syzygium grande]
MLSIIDVRIVIVVDHPPILVAAAPLLVAAAPNLPLRAIVASPRGQRRRGGAPLLGVVDEDRGKAEATPNGERREEMQARRVVGVQRARESKLEEDRARGNMGNKQETNES